MVLLSLRCSNAFIFTLNWALEFLISAPCTVASGESHLIMSIVESVGDDTTQTTEPARLPISGSPGSDIRLELHYADEEPSSRKFFTLDENDQKKLRLVKPLDRDEEDLSSVMFQVTCTTLDTGRRKTIPVVVTISDVNDNAPEFMGAPYVIAVPESTPVNTTVFRGLKAHDPDSNVNGQVEFRVVPADNNDIDGDEETDDSDGYGAFEIDLPHQGLLRLTEKLDYERTKRHYVTIVASDRAVDEANRFSVTTTLTVNVIDSDDQDPIFSEKEYTAKVVRGMTSGALEVRPEKISAEDSDSLRTPVLYSFSGGEPSSYSSYFSIDPKTGVVSQVRAVGPDSPVEKFELRVRAEEVSSARRSARTKLVINVLAEDINPPELRATAIEGFVDENAPVGTKVKDANGNDIRLLVSDKDRVSKTRLFIKLVVLHFNVLRMREKNLRRMNSK